MTGMFANASALTSLDLSSFDTSNVTSMTDMFTKANALNQLKLGSKSMFDATAVKLPAITTGGYTGAWVNVGAGTVDAPEGNIKFANSTEFMTNYDGSNPDTYVWEETKGTVTVKYADEIGDIVSPDVVLTGKIGDSYTVDKKAIPGYVFKSIDIGSESGTFTNTAQTVVCTYTQAQK